MVPARTQLEEISWNEWFEKFDSNNLAFRYQSQKASGEDSTFFKLVQCRGSELRNQPPLEAWFKYDAGWFRESGAAPFCFKEVTGRLRSAPVIVQPLLSPGKPGY